MLSHCLEKLQNQTFRDFKVLVIDNASDQPPLLDLCVRYTNVTLVQNQANLGFAAANNQAIKLLDESDWVGLLNPDAFPDPDWLEQLINAVKNYPGYTMFASRQLMEGNSKLLDGDGDIYHISGLVWRKGHGQPVYEAALEPQEVFSPCAAAALYKREALLSVGGFDEDFFCYVEDVDLSFRLRLLGHRCLLVPDAVVHHVGSGTTGGRHSDFSVYHGHRNLVWTFVKNMPGALFWMLLPLQLLLNVVTIVVFMARGQGGVILRAKKDAVKGLPQAWAKRQQIQNSRKASVSEIWRVLDKRLFRSMRR
ncbi:Glycosyltransferase [Candidatus Methylobacter favarea]|uniref:Glycosyltransferase n=2 Tax=Candidatus Methylobacter favarea TaxID=2707345 RepID=A0A8S0XG45_9GAMM|nr:Glycosyltransferase [Candidatus Methylobacter favarea]